jgi:hypothetical protein
LTSDEFVSSLEAKVTCKKALVEEAQARRIIAEGSNEMQGAS